MRGSGLNNPLLHRYWFKTKVGLGIGVTAYSIEDARRLIEEVVRPQGLEREVLEIIADVECASSIKAMSSPIWSTEFSRSVASAH